MDQIDKIELLPTSIIDSDHKKIIEYAMDKIGDRTGGPMEKAVKIYENGHAHEIITFFT